MREEKQSFFESDRRRLVRFAKKRRREPGKFFIDFPGSRRRLSSDQSKNIITRENMERLDEKIFCKNQKNEKKWRKNSKKGLTKREERGIIIELSARAGSEVIEN